MRKYAKHRGVSPEAVSKAVKQGRISTVTDENGRRKIDPNAADNEWAKNTDKAKIREPSAELDSDDEKPRGPSYAQSRAIREAFAARLAKLEFEEKIGRLVDGDETRKLWVTVAAIVRTKVMGIPSKIRQVIPNISLDQYLVIERIVRETLEDVANERP